MQANREWIASKNGRKGIVSHSNKLILEIEYDEITKRQDSHFRRFYSLKKNDKYGAYKFDYNYNAQLIKAELPKPVGGINIDYMNINRFVMLELVDEKGNFFCYALPDGKVFYSAK